VLVKGASAPDDLRHPLVAHAHDLGNGGHRQSVAVGGADGVVALLAQLVACLLPCCLALGVARGKGRQAASGLGSLAFGASDLRIV
jgi:hypothetical protein